MNQIRSKILLFLFGAITMNAAIAQSPKVLLIDANRLVELKKKVQQNDKQVLQLIDSLKKQADEFLMMKPVSVTNMIT
jgi:hypothetical protein